MSEIANRSSLPSIQLKWTEDLQIEYLKLLAKTGNVNTAGARLGITDKMLAKARKDDSFRQAELQARAMMMGVIEDEMHKRAIEGEQEPIYYRDQLVGYKTVKSDKILLELARANDPDRYGKRESTTNVVNVNGNDALNKLSQFLGVDMKDVEKAQGDNIIDGEYTES